LAKVAVLPDIILVDLAPDTPLLVFVEAVATEGPISESRQAALLKLATDAGYERQDVAFVSAFMDRASSAFRKVCSELAWGSFAWFATEPDLIVGYFGKAQHTLLSELARRGEATA
jgi:hypothetical protein